MATEFTPLQQALVLRALREARDPQAGALRGSGAVELRRTVANGEHDSYRVRRQAARVEREIRSMTASDWPFDSALVTLLHEALVARIGSTHTNPEGWRAIGIEPRTGDALLGRRPGAVTWPVFRTLRDAALDGLDLQSVAD